MVVGALGGEDTTLKEICEGVQQKRAAKKCWNAARAKNQNIENAIRIDAWNFVLQVSWTVQGICT